MDFFKELGARARKVGQELAHRHKAAQKVVKEHRDKAAEALFEHTVRAGEKVGIEREKTEAARDKARDVAQAIEKKAEQLKDDVVDMTDRAAVKVAAQVSEARGVETTPEQVKKVAKIVGIAILAAGAAELIVDAISEGAGGEAFAGADGFGGEGLEGGGGEGALDAPGGRTGDAVDDAKMFLAEQGSPMNEITHVVDGDGVILDHGG